MTDSRTQPRTSAKSGVRSFTDRLFDYAGLYPPASLPLPAAVSEYAAHLLAKEAWMLGPFVLHASTLADLYKRQVGLERFKLSVLCATNQSRESYPTSLAKDLDNVSKYNNAGVNEHDSPIYSLETGLPTDALALDPKPFLDALRSAISAREIHPQLVFIELNPQLAEHAVERWAEAVAEFQGGVVSYALKLRCGGVQAHQVPDVQSVATFIEICHRQNCAFKATAGLHHPVRGQHHTASVPMHGFLNVIGAAVLRHANVADKEQTLSIVRETDPTAFHLDESGFRWRALSATPDQIAACRREFALSIGSCSFNEPVDDLRALGILQSE